MEELELELKELDTTKKLTGKQERFCQEYVRCLNKAKAYSIAYNRPYESIEDKNKASAMGCRLYGNVRVNARIKQLVEEANKKCDVTLEFIITQQLQALERMNKGKKEKKIDFNGNVVDTGEIEYDNKAINGALKNLADFTGLSVQTIKAQVEAKTDVKIVSAHDVAKSILDITPDSEKVDDLIDA